MMKEEDSQKRRPSSLLVEKTSVNCLSCHERVEVALVQFGGGRVAKCPLCGRIAYSSDEGE